MKKMIISIALVLTIISCKLSIVKSANFPNKITNIAHSSDAYYGNSGFGVTRKSGTIDNKTRGVFCTVLYRSGVPTYATLKTSNQWPKPIQAGVATIIKDYWQKYRNVHSNGVRHYNTTYAINIFLHNHLSQNKGERPSNVYYLWNAASQALTNAENVYNKISKQMTIKFSANKLTYNKPGADDDYYYSNYVSVGGNYYDSLNVVSSNVKVNNETYKCSDDNCKVVQSSDKKKYRLKIDKKWIEGQCTGSCDVETSITFQAKRTYYIAAEYYGNGAQDVVPDYLVKTTENSAKKTISGTFKVKDTTTTCDGQLNEILTNNKDKKELVTLYETYGKKYDQIFNSANPTCSSSTQESSMSCEGSSLSINKVEKLNETQYLYCTLNYDLDSQIFDNTTINKGNLLYHSDDGTVATAHVTYSCSSVTNDPILASYTYTIDISSLIPNLSFKVLDKNISLNKSIQLENNDCSISNNDKISCTPKLDNDKNYGFVIAAQVNYSYNDTNKYSFNKKNYQFEVTSDCKDNYCIPYGYGIRTIAKTEDKSATDVTTNVATDLKTDATTDLVTDVKLNWKDTLFSDDNKNVECPVKLEKNNYKKDILYRPIETSNPFLDKSGKERYTGSNWCLTDTKGQSNTFVERDKNDSDDLTNNNSSQTCYYKGDLNQNGIWDWDDYDIMRNYLANKITLTSEQMDLVDINHDKENDKSDLTVLSNHINNLTTAYGGIYHYVLNPNSGDINFDGMVDSTDVMLISKAINNVWSPQEFQIKQGDVNKTCTINMLDGIQIQKQQNTSEENEIDFAESQEDNSQQYEIDENDDIYDDSKDSNSLPFNTCSPNNNTVLTYIKSRANSNGVIENTNDKVEPLYSFTLTPDDIKNIREYNKKNEYDDFNLTCTNGKECISDFVSTYLENGLCNQDRTKFCKR